MNIAHTFTPPAPTFMNGAKTTRESDYQRMVWDMLREADSEGFDLTQIASKLIDKNPDRQKAIFRTYRHYWMVSQAHRVIAKQVLNEELRRMQ